MMGYGYGLGFGGLGGVLWSVGGMLLMVGLVILGIWLFTRLVSPDAPAGERTGGGDALEILRSRFARGEISEAEFSQTKKTLGYE